MSEKKYSPPFTITSSILSLVADISHVLGRLSVIDPASGNLRLRKANRIRTIQGSLAIEGNTLTEDQMHAIMEGKQVIAPPREIQEVRNAIKAYELCEQWTAHSKKDMLTAHGILMTGLLDHPGAFRTGGVGVMAGNTVVHLAPPAARVPYLMDDLFNWIETTDVHPLIAGSVFHYEFEFIHPFADGNGRMGRLWQTLILSRWNQIFVNVPVESIIHKHQAEYYASLSTSTRNSESTVFIEFMLNRIFEAIHPLLTPEETPEATPEVKKMLLLMDGEMTRRQIQEKLGLKDEKHFRQNYQQPAVAQGLIEMTIPDKPNSRLQKYKITPKGRLIVEIVGVNTGGKNRE